MVSQVEPVVKEEMGVTEGRVNKVAEHATILDAAPLHSLVRMEGQGATEVPAALVGTGVMADLWF